MSEEQAEYGHGGRREGAGRKPEGDVPKRPITFRLAQDVIDYLRGHRLPAAQVVERAVRAWRDRENG